MVLSVAVSTRHTFYFIFSSETPGRNLQYVTAHELGHSLGLDHSSTQGALMWPFILGYVPDYQLPEDDRLGIQEIYGEFYCLRDTLYR